MTLQKCFTLSGRHILHLEKSGLSVNNFRVTFELENLSVADLISHFLQGGGRDNFFVYKEQVFILQPLIQEQEKEM